MSPTIAYSNIIYEYASKKEYITVGLCGRRGKNDTSLVWLYII